MKGTFYINGKPETLEFSPSSTLLELLRGNRHTDVKNGCEAGTCGSCAVLLDGVLVLSCQCLAASAIGRKIITVSGLGDVHNPHPIQRAFVDSGAVQCGFCTPGKVLATFALLLDNPNPTDKEIKVALDGHLCRCTGYVKIIEAVRLSAQYMKEVRQQGIDSSNPGEL